jgi:hypothetical protein
LSFLGEKVLADPEHCGIIKSVSAIANCKQRIKTIFMDDILCTYEIDIGKIDVKLLKPSVQFSKGGGPGYYDNHNSLWGYLPGWLLEPTYATSCIRGKIFNSCHTVIFLVRDASDNTNLYIVYIKLYCLLNIYVLYISSNIINNNNANTIIIIIIIDF